MEMSGTDEFLNQPDGIIMKK